MPFAPRDNFAGYHPDPPSYYARDSRSWNTTQPREGGVYANSSTHSQFHPQRYFSRPGASAVEPQIHHDSRPTQQSSSSPNSRERSPRVALPSISSLLNLADDERPAQFNPQSRRDLSLSTPQQRFATQPATSHPSVSTNQSLHAWKPPRDSPIPGQHPAMPALTAPLIKQEHSPEAHRYTLDASPSQHPRAFPPTPLFRADRTAENVQSPSALSNSSFSSQHYFLNTVNNPEPRAQRTDQSRAFPHQSHKRTHSGRSASPPLLKSSPVQSTSWTRSPGATSTSSQCSPRTIPHHHFPTPTTSAPQHATQSGLAQQRPLPANFPPAPSTPATASSAQHPQQQQYSPSAIIKPEPSPTADLQTSANPWEHHHYISPSSQQPYQPTQDRYICQTCKKAFSRPSSLKIHSHSHTGEKPFKCPYSGCGKAFSVRSNMKRHERGCHSGSAAAAGAMIGIPSLLQ
ncbi:hypothetical protein K431DRAFT_302827 [Polychaeton citri CBS 116435]|uniref:C2H2-type domain-containing protein n=1 Tax=Polychaeton citri CBS 116435 TaxID=1314669 RepID=A0A9P4QCD1_9PEZI|nr:hypothetical protein K431DRAFT_302827 [Polychaeton citri CBS 116435]